MVYVPTRRDVDTQCETYFDAVTNPWKGMISRCQAAGDTPYCWPANGTRICAGDENYVSLIWSANFYNPGALLYIDFGDQHSQGPKADGSIKATKLQQSLTGWEDHTERVPSEYSNNEQILRITIREWYRSADSIKEAVHEGPTLTLRPTPTSTAAAVTATSPTTSNGLKPGAIAGIGFGAFCALVVLTSWLYFYCARCLACCSPGKAEIKRVRAAERRRVQEERAYAQRDVDAIKAAVARGEVWQGPVRPGGMWVSRSNWPAAPSGVARPSSSASRADDEIRAVDETDGQERRWREEQRRELEMIEDRRRQEQSVAVQREETQRADDPELPAYEMPPPKYTP